MLAFSLPAFYDFFLFPFVNLLARGTKRVFCSQLPRWRARNIRPGALIYGTTATHTHTYSWPHDNLLLTITCDSSPTLPLLEITQLIVRHSKRKKGRGYTFLCAHIILTALTGNIVTAEEFES